MTGIDPGQGPPGHDEGCPPAGKQPSASNFNPTSTIVQHEAPPIPSVADVWALYPLPPSVGCARCEYGLAFEDGRKRCPRHWTDADRAVVGELNRRGRAIGLKPHPRIEGERLYPYGPKASVAMRRRMLDWAETAELRFADGSHICPAWVAGDRCPGVRRCPGQNIRALLGPLDHATNWTGPAGLRLIVAQPYAVTSSDAPSLQALNAVPGLHLGVTPPGASWYGHETWMVTIAGFPVDGQEVA